MLEHGKLKVNGLAWYYGLYCRTNAIYYQKRVAELQSLDRLIAVSLTLSSLVTLTSISYAVEMAPWFSLITVVLSVGGIASRTSDQLGKHSALLLQYTQHSQDFLKAVQHSYTEEQIYAVIDRYDETERLESGWVPNAKKRLLREAQAEAEAEAEVQAPA